VNTIWILMFLGNVACRMLKDDEGTKMMLFFGFIGCLNLVALFPIMFVLVEASVVSLANVTTRIFMLAVAKGTSPVLYGNLKVV
jgi:hypothetical protein